MLLSIINLIIKSLILIADNNVTNVNAQDVKRLAIELRHAAYTRKNVTEMYNTMQSLSKTFTDDMSIALFQGCRYYFTNAIETIVEYANGNEELPTTMFEVYISESYTIFDER